MADTSGVVNVDYCHFFSFPPRPSSNRECIAKCKTCSKNYKYTLTTKGNLLKHLQVSHGRQLESYKQERRRSMNQGQISLTGGTFGRRKDKAFQKQDAILTSFARNVCGHGGLPIHTCEQTWFRDFMNDVEPRFTPVSRVAVKRKLNTLYTEERSSFFSDLSSISPRKPSVTVDFWTGCDGRSFMGCTVHYVCDGMLKDNILFFKEVPPPHTSINIRNRFEDELDYCRVEVFCVVTDNAANMKCAFTMEVDASLNSECPDEEEDDIINDEDPSDVTETNDANLRIFSRGIEYWTMPQPSVVQPHFDTWIGCAAHQLQLVVHAGYKELLNYRRVQVALNKAKAICKLSHQSSHFKYSLSHSIPAPNDTRWNSHLKLHQHVLEHCESINKALEENHKQELVITTTDKENLSNVIDVMSYFAEATDILQRDKEPTSNRVIPVVDSLENALKSAARDSPSINALCEALSNSLQLKFSYLLDSAFHQAATALDPQVKLSFATSNNSIPGKFFTFNTAVVKENVKKLLPVPPAGGSHSLEETDRSRIAGEGSSKKRLLDFSSTSLRPTGFANDIDAEMEAYFAHPTMDIKPLKFWMERKESPLRNLALQLYSVPCSSASVERLFSKAGIILSQRRTRLQSARIEQLLFLK